MKSCWLYNKTVIITGGASGIGGGIARLLIAEYACRVIAVIINDVGLDQTIRELGENSDKFICLHYDVSRYENWVEIKNYLESHSIQADVLINNAGIFSYRDMADTPVERIERMILLHDLTLTKNCRTFGAKMAQRGHGYILNMSSYSVWMPFPGMALYTATKAYVRSFTKAFAKEMKERGVRVTAVCPAGVATDLYGLTPEWQRIGQRCGALISPDSCARRGLRALRRGRRCIVPDWWNRLFIPLFLFMPDPLVSFIRRRTLRFQC